MMHSPTHAVQEAKALLRTRIKALRAALSDDARRAGAAALATRPLPVEVIPPPGGVIAGYWPIKGELDPLPLMLALASQGFALALPRITPLGLDFHAFRPEDPLEPGAFGTREPRASSARVTPDLILTPLLAFDVQGGRLGFGKGFYDRTFAALPQAKRLGLAYAFQCVDAVPGEAHDLPLDTVLVV